MLFVPFLSRNISLHANVVPKATNPSQVAFHSPSRGSCSFRWVSSAAISGLEDRSHWPPGNPSARKIRRTMTRRMRRSPQWSAWTDAACARFKTGGLGGDMRDKIHIPRFGIDRNRSNKKNVRTDASIPHYYAVVKRALHHYWWCVS